MTKNDLSRTINDRFNNPVYGAVILSWVAWNWDILYFITLSTLPIEARIYLVREEYYNTDNAILYPLYSAAGLLIGIPYIQLLIDVLTALARVSNEFLIKAVEIVLRKIKLLFKNINLDLDVKENDEHAINKLRLDKEKADADLQKANKAIELYYRKVTKIDNIIINSDIMTKTISTSWSDFREDGSAPFIDRTKDDYQRALENELKATISIVRNIREIIDSKD